MCVVSRVCVCVFVCGLYPETLIFVHFSTDASQRSLLEFHHPHSLAYYDKRYKKLSLLRSQRRLEYLAATTVSLTHNSPIKPIQYSHYWYWLAGHPPYSHRTTHFRPPHNFPPGLHRKLEARNITLYRL